MPSYDDLALTTTKITGRGQSFAAEFPIDVRPITLDADLVLATYTDGVIPAGATLGLNPTTKRYGPYAGTSDEVQTITITGSPTGGTWIPTFAAVNGAAVAFNATAASLQATLEAMSSIGVGNILVTGSAGGPYTLTFRGALADTNTAQFTSTPSLTGGTSPTVVHATTTAGGADLASNGMQIARGHLLSGAFVRAGKHVAAALYYKGRIFEDLLPANGGFDANAKADLANFIVYDRIGA